MGSPVQRVYANSGASRDQALSSPPEAAGTFRFLEADVGPNLKGLYMSDGAQWLFIGPVAAAVTQQLAGARVTRAAVFSLPNNVNTAIPWDAPPGTPGVNAYEFGTFFNAGNPTRLTVPAGAAGIYAIDSNFSIAANATGLRFMQFFLNGAGAGFFSFGQNAGSAFNHDIAGGTKIRLAVGDFIEVIAFQNSGGALDIQANAASPFFSLQLLRPN